MPDNAKLNFSLDEYERRLSKTRRAMSDRNIDCLLVVDPSNMAWLSGYDGWSFYTHQCVIVQHDHEPIWWGRGIDAPGALRTTYLAVENILKYPDHYVQSTERHPMEAGAGPTSGSGLAFPTLTGGDGTTPLTVPVPVFETVINKVMAPTSHTDVGTRSNSVTSKAAAGVVLGVGLGVTEGVALGDALGVAVGELVGLDV